ncbi:MAG: 5'-nucleotidase SurE [Thermoanaerobacterales bacterium 50_218]|nr:MAG: 5'-nucleotidase SurE [Thermoanaerobacterales bacterium 50_218]HAA90363.1 5'/3'-nucleotidase SurE [Peptococcaceae bacterium]
MQILLTNDDSIYAEGLAVLWSALSEIAEVTVVAPDRERSATGHGITVDQPLRAERVSLFSGAAWAVNGTPADCVKLGVNCLLKDKPDVVVAGINRGPNLGIDVLYSGTVSGALEGLILGIPAIAVSVADYANPDYRYAAYFTKKLVPRILETDFCTDTLLNVNVPSLPAEEIRGVRITRLGNRKYLNSFEVRKDPRGKLYYWLGGDVIDLDDDPDTDVAAIREKMVSITPIHIDLTNYRAIRALEKLLPDLEGEVLFSKEN